LRSLRQLDIMPRLLGQVRAIERWIERHGAIVLDGALATELERRGFDLRDPLWSARVLVERPEAIRDVHRAYFEAGADVATTASYQATFQGFEKRGISRERARELLLSSVELAREARDQAERAGARPGRPRALIAASVGSYGAYLADGSEFRGDYGLAEDELARFHRERITVLASSDADLLAFETIPCLVEARALVRVLREHPNASAWLSFSCRDGLRTSNGEPIAECAAELERCDQIAAVGVNCTAPRHLPSLLTELARATRKPLVVYPNSGERFDPATRSWCDLREPFDFAAAASSWYDAGARLIGGCCRTTPNDIHAVAGFVRSLMRGG
jgi:homocysteine S-methyltransferase